MAAGFGISTLLEYFTDDVSYFLLALIAAVITSIGGTYYIMIRYAAKLNTAVKAGQDDLLDDRL